MKKQKILVAVSSHSELGLTGRKTGYYLPEVSLRGRFYDYHEAQGDRIDRS